MLYFFYKQFISNLLSESEKEREIPEKEDKTEELCKSGMPNRPSGKGSHFYIDTNQGGETSKFFLQDQNTQVCQQNYSDCQIVTAYTLAGDTSIN